jgi:hypothetical protein
LQDIPADGDDKPRPLSATQFESVDGRIQHSLLALVAPEVGAEPSPDEGGPARSPEAIARLLRAVADLLDEGGER